MEPTCRICNPCPASSAAIDPRVLASRYRSYVARRREFCDLGKCNAKVGTNLRPEFNSRSYDVRRLVDKIEELDRSVQDLERARCDKAENVEQTSIVEESADTEITDLKDAHVAAENCLLDIERIRTFLADENSWWEMLKEQSVNCCQEKSPHLHGVLNGSSVTLMLHEEGIDVAPRRFTSTPKKSSNVAHFSFQNSRGERTSETKCTDQSTDTPWEQRPKGCTVPCYSFDMKSTLIEVGSSERQDSAPRYTKTSTKNKPDTTASEVWMEKDKSDEQRMSDRPYKSKKTRDKSQERKEKRTDRSNVVPPKEVRYDQSAGTMFEEPVSRSRETFSNENIGNTKHFTVDFTSNVDRNAEFPSTSTASHKPRTKMVTEKIVYRVQKSPARVSKSRD